jgi:catechol 2,3-dioxygenase-like lactoylglutathione lyase family enzyme
MLDSATSHGTIAVSDIERAKAFYGGTLGLKVNEERSDGVTYATANGGFAGTAQSTAMTFEVADLDTAVKELRAAGVTFEEYDFPDLKTVDGIAEIQGERAAWFKDPDGNILAIGQRT